MRMTAVLAGRAVLALRLVPEPVKRRLRPVFVRVVIAGSALPGVGPLARAVLLRSPRLRVFLARRYRSYALVSGYQSRPEWKGDPDGLNQSESLQLAWLKTWVHPGGMAPP